MQEVPTAPEAPPTPEQERETLTDEVQSDNILFEGIPGVTDSHYVIRPEDQSSWLPAWQLRVDRFGVEYGIPTRLPKGQLDHFLLKRRTDGGKRFTLTQPPNVLPEPQFGCFIGDCRKRVRERIHLVRHVEVCHAQEAAAYKPFLDKLRQAVIEDNAKLAELVDGIAATPDQPIRAVSVQGQDAVPDVVPATVERAPEAVEYVPAHPAPGWNSRDSDQVPPPGHAHCDPRDGGCGWTSSKPKKNVVLSLLTHQRDCPARVEAPTTPEEEEEQ